MHTRTHIMYTHTHTQISMILLFERLCEQVAYVGLLTTKNLILDEQITFFSFAMAKHVILSSHCVKERIFHHQEDVRF